MSWSITEDRFSTDPSLESVFAVGTGSSWSDSTVRTSSTSSTMTPTWSVPVSRITILPGSLSAPGSSRRAARSKIGMILPRRPMTPRIHGTSDATERGSVKRMTSCTAPMGSAYSSLPSEKTTSWCEVVSGMAGLPGGRSAR